MWQPKATGTLRTQARKDYMDNKVVPDKATRDKIFGVVKALFVGARNGAKTGLKREFTSWPSIIGIWIPVILLVVSLSLGIIYKYDLFGLGKATRLQVVWIVSVLLMYVFTALSSVVDAFISIRGTINMLPVTTDRAMKTADSLPDTLLSHAETGG
jgi:hypothetical protein